MSAIRKRSKSKIGLELEYLFVETAEGKAKCIICKQVQIKKIFNIFRHYNRHHKNIYKSYSNDEKQKLLESYKNQINMNKRNETVLFSCSHNPDNQSNSFNNPSTTNVIISNKESLAVSYAVALEIGKKKKNFSDRPFIKDCAIAMAEAFGNNVAMEQFKTVALSRQTIFRRITSLNNFLETELRIIIQNSVYFSLCLDENTDISDISQLLIFIRTVGNDFIANEELLELHSLYETTKGTDIYSGVKKAVEKYTTFDKCSCIVTDGTPAMVGIENGFVGILRKNNIKCVTLHCIVHQEALYTKSLKLTCAMDLVVKVTNLIRGGNKALSHRKFKMFLNDVDAAYGDLSLHSEVRWLSARICLKRFFALRKEISEFLKTQVTRDTNEIQEKIQSYEFLSELAFLTDITSYLNELNLNLQGKNQNICDLFGHVVEFRKKLELLKENMKKNQLINFPCAEIQTEYTNVNFSHFHNNLSTLLYDFNTRFADFELMKHDIDLFFSPLTAKISDQKSELQLELHDLQNDTYFASIKETDEHFFKLLPMNRFPKLRDFGLKMYSMFGTTCICESTFSSMKHIKSTSRSVLLDNSLLAQLRIATTKIPINISKIISQQTNINTSH